MMRNRQCVSLLLCTKQLIWTNSVGTELKGRSFAGDIFCEVNAFQVKRIVSVLH